MKRQFFENYEKHNNVTLKKINEDVYSDRDRCLVIRFIGENKWDAQDMLQLLDSVGAGSNWLEHDLRTNSYVLYTEGVKL